MTCPHCKARDTVDARFCTHCGVILRKDALNTRAPQPAVPSGARLRLVAVVIAGMAGAGAGYLIGRNSDAARPIATFFGLVIGCALVYIVTGFKILYLTNIYRVQLTGLNHQISSHLDKTIDRLRGQIEKAREKNEQVPVESLEELGAAHLLKDEIQESIEAFNFAHQHGGSLTAEPLNNAGIAFMKAGRRRHAYESFERAFKEGNGSPEPRVNLSHFLSESFVGSESQNLNRALEQVQGLISRDENKTSHLNRKGFIHLRRGENDDALQAFQQALEESKGDKYAMANARNNIGYARFYRGDVKGALEDFRAAVRLDPGHGRAMGNQGVALVQLDSVREGLERLQRAAEMDPKSAPIYSNLGYVLCLAGAVNDGIVALRKAESLDPSAYEPVYNLGKSYADFGIADVANRYLDRASQIQPNSWQTLLAQGVVMMQLGHFVEARKPLERAAELKGDEPAVLADYGVCLAMVMRYEEAEQYLKEAVKIRKDSAAMYSLLAWVQCMNENYSAASEALAVALNLDPRDVLVNDNYGLTALEMKSPDSAMKHFREALKLKPRYHRVRYHIGYVHALNKKIDLAIDEWEKSVEHETGFADVFVNLGVSYYLLERLDDAIVQFRRVLTMRHDRMEDYSNLAMAFAKQGVALRKGLKDPNDIDNPRVRNAREKFSQAVGMFDRAIELAPKNVILHSNRGLACFFANRVEDAMYEWSSVSTLDAEYAKRRGHLMQTVFDEAAVQFVSLKVSERVSRHPFLTADYAYRLAPSYDADAWEYMLRDDELKPVPGMAAEADRLGRALKALKQ